MTPQPCNNICKHAAMILLLMAALAIAAAAQSSGSGVPPVAANPDINRTELNNFDRYLDDHPNVARELRNNPNLVNDPNYLAQHPSLQGFLKNHTGVNEEIRENPAQFMNRENRFERNGGDISRREAGSADRFLDSHPQVAQQLQQDPRLIDNPNYVAQHPGLQQYLQNHPEARQDWKQHPYAFEKRQRQYEKHEYRKPQSSWR